eukprot:2589454-Amphidinium_carterae.1
MPHMRINESHAPALMYAGVRRRHYSCLVSGLVEVNRHDVDNWPATNSFFLCMIPCRSREVSSTSGVMYAVHSWTDFAAP